MAERHLDRRRLFRGLGTAGLSAVLLGGLLWRLDSASIFELLAGSGWGWVLLASALGPVQVLLGAERWRRASAALDLELPRAEAVREYALSTLLNQLLPGGVAGDGARVLRQRRQGLSRVLRAAVVDRALGQAALGLLVALGLLAWPGRPAGSLALAGAVLLGLLGLATLARRTVAEAVLPELPAHLLTSLLLLASFLLGFALCGRALDLEAGPWLWSAVPLVLLAMSLPVSWGGWGPRELTAGAVLPALGWSPEQGVALAALYGLSVLLGALPGALVPLLDRGTGPVPPAAAPPPA